MILEKLELKFDNEKVISISKSINDKWDYMKTLKDLSIRSLKS
jgi:viroplasmin and RNaseH domain-containing protein